jgi:hypothetical protein
MNSYANAGRSMRSSSKIHKGGYFPARKYPIIQSYTLSSLLTMNRRSARSVQLVPPVVVLKPSALPSQT